MADAPTPSFCASGGDVDRQTYQFFPGLGVWCCDELGRWEDHSGTSYAAPLVAREAAIALQYLQEESCPQGRPFAVTVRAFLALTAKKPFVDNELSKFERDLCKRTLGLGVPEAKRLAEPNPNSAIFLWQRVLEDKNDLVAVQLPVPSDWRTQAKAPRLRVVVAYDPPVNQAVQEVWACRKVEIKLKTNQMPEAKGVTSKSRGHRSYPLLDRTYDLRIDAEADGLIEETWRLELHYEEIADYPPGPIFSSQQRVAVAMELFDDDELPMSPQQALQALPVTTTMKTLSVPPATFRRPIILPSR